jgi:hypothetical protein
MTDALSKLRELERDLRSNKYAAFGSIAYEGQLEFADRIKALLAALEQRERELIDRAIGAFDDAYCRVDDPLMGVIKGRKAMAKLRAALNPTPCTCDEGVGAFCDQHAKERSEYMEKRKGLRTGMTN